MMNEIGMENIGSSKEAYDRWACKNNESTAIQRAKEIQRNAAREALKDEKRRRSFPSFSQVIQPEWIEPPPPLSASWADLSIEDQTHQENEAIQSLGHNRPHFERYRHCEGLRIILRYYNRKLYDTMSSHYVNLTHIEQMIQAGWRIRVISWPKKKDQTAFILSLHWVRRVATEMAGMGFSLAGIHDAMKSLPGTLEAIHQSKKIEELPKRLQIEGK